QPRPLDAWRFPIRGLATVKFTIIGGTAQRGQKALFSALGQAKLSEKQPFLAQLPTPGRWCPSRIGSRKARATASTTAPAPIGSYASPTASKVERRNAKSIWRNAKSCAIALNRLNFRNCLGLKSRGIFLPGRPKLG